MRLHPGALRLAAAFMLGMACALWLFPVLAGRTVQELRLARDREQARAGALATELQQMRDAENRRQSGSVVKRTHAHVEGPDKDQRVALEVERRLQKRLAEHEGRPVGEISFLLLYSKFQGNLFEVDGVLYQLDVKAVALVGPDLTLYGVIVPVNKG